MEDNIRYRLEVAFEERRFVALYLPMLYGLVI